MQPGISRSERIEEDNGVRFDEGTNVQDINLYMNQSCSPNSGRCLPGGDMVFHHQRVSHKRIWVLNAQ